MGNGKKRIQILKEELKIALKYHRQMAKIGLKQIYPEDPEANDYYASAPEQPKHKTDMDRIWEAA